MGIDEALGSLLSSEWNLVHQRVNEFEKARRSDSQTDLAKFLPEQDDGLYPLVLVELVKSDMDFAWHGGVQILLEEYLARFTSLKKNATVVSKLLCEEYRIREECGERPSLDEYKRRFPEYYREFTNNLNTNNNKGNDFTNPSNTRNMASPPPSRSLTPNQKSFRAGEMIAVGDGYKLLEELGEGKFGKVWKAESANGKFVALKIITWPADHPAAKRELQSLEILKNVSHPYLLEIHSFYSWNDRIVVVMGLADASLRDRLLYHQRKNELGIPLEELLQYMREAADALDFLNRQDIQHRDIKPGNILLAAGHVRIGDLGLAKLVEDRQMIASILGTPPYMAPEVWLGKVHDTSDQYSLAVTYLELRRGRRAFDTGQVNGLEEKHLGEMPATVPLSDAEKKILLRAGSKDPDQRFSSCAEFVNVLEETLRPSRPVGYRKLKRINSGSFGDVWRGEAPGGKAVAIKTIRLADSKSVDAELKAMEHIKDFEHPHLVTIFAFWNEEDDLHIAMTLADRSLRDFLHHRQQYYPDEGIPRPKLHQYMLEAAQALDFLHTRDIVHRDVKPENILLKDDRVKVADFGLAKMLERQQLFTATMSGTMAYMSPEAWSGKVSKQSDQYSLAVTYYELRVGKPLYTPSSLQEMMTAHQTCEPDLSALPEDERPIVKRALSKNPEDRFEFCFDFVNNLKLVHAPPTVNVRPDTLGDTGTLHPESFDSDPTPRISSGKIQVWRDNQGKWSKTKIWRYVIGLAAVAVFSGVAVWLMMRGSGTEPVIAPEPKITLTALRSEINAGEKASLKIGIDRDYWTGPIEFDFRLPKGVTTKKAKVTAEENQLTVEIPITAEADATPKTYKASVVTRFADKEHPAQRFDLIVKPLTTLPLPDEAGAFTPAARTEICSVGGKEYYREIDCDIAGESMRVGFLLIYSKDTDKIHFEPFYMMRDMAWNGLYRIFAEKLKRVKDKEWLKGGAIESADGTASEDLGAAHPNWPVLRVDFPDAQRFAKWLGGSLPTQQQWEWAAGRRQTKDMRMGAFIPTEFNWCSIIGLGANAGANRLNLTASACTFPGVAIRYPTPLPIGHALWDVSPFGCRDMSGNGYEWTSSSNLEANLRFLRSASYNEKRSPFVFTEKRIPFRTIEPPMPGFPDGRPLYTIGVRVVVAAGK